MRFPLLFLLLALLGWAEALSVSPPLNSEKRMRFTAVSERILLVEVTAVEDSEPEVDAGLQRKTRSIKAQVVEVVRGKWMEPQFKESVENLKLVDEEALQKSLGRPFEGFEREFYLLGIDQTGIFDCQLGKRYLAIHVGNVGRLNMQNLYVSADGEGWKKEIRDYDPEQRKIMER